MGILEWLADIRIPIITELMLLITHLGEEKAFLVIALVLFWCVDKRQGYYILAVGFLGTIVNQFLKMLFRVPRPWERVPDFQAVEAAKKEATGFSFPSGHTQSSVGVFGGIGFHTNSRFLRWICVMLVVLIPFSRLYLGVHTPQDVIVSVAVALFLIFAVYPFVFGGNFFKRMSFLLGFMLFLNLAYLVFVHNYHFPANTDAVRLASGYESGYTLLGALLGFMVVFLVDEKWVQFPVKAVWWAQIIKTLLGVGIVLAVMGGLKAPLNQIFGIWAGRTIRYFLVVCVAGLGWPLTFRWFGRLGKSVREI